MKRWLGPAATVLAVLLLHVVTTFPMLATWDTFLANVSRGSIDLLLLLAAALFGGAIGRPRLAAHLLTIALLLLTAFRAAVVLMPAVRGCEFELGHVRELSAVWHYVTHDRPIQEIAVLVGTRVLAAVVAYTVIVWAFLRVARVGTRPRRALAFAGALQACVVAGVLWASASPAAPSPWNPPWCATFATRTWNEIRHRIDPSIVDAPIRASIVAAADVMDRAPGDLGRLGGADVHLVLLESYGRVAQRHPVIADRMRAVYDELAADAQQAGFTVMSSVCYPAVRGGGSWLARAQLYSAVMMNSERALHLLLASELQALPAKFCAAGYHTVEVQSAMPYRVPERAAFFGFRDEITQAELGYEGPPYHWGLMPDQFALHHLLRKVVEPARGPLFTSFVSATNHAPFSHLPRYVENWCIDADTFRGPPLAVREVPAYGISPARVTLDAYRDTLEYSLRTVVGFVCRLQRPSLVLVIGDHQPAFASLLVPPDRSFDVPLHVFANRPELLTPLETPAFVRGFVVPDAIESFSTTLIAPSLLRAFAK